MFKILLNLKESIISVIIIVLLLCVQAWTDLTLPDYTSKIVNIGIQQGGIESTNPDVINKKEMFKQMGIMEGMSDSIIEQAAINAVKEDYKAEGIDTDYIQNISLFQDFKC